MEIDFKPKVTYCILAVLLLIMCSEVLMFLGIKYSHEKQNVSNESMTVQEIINTDNPIKEELTKHMAKEDINSRLYDRVNIEAGSTNYLEWLKTRHINTEISSIKENTETVKNENVNITSEIKNNKQVYIVGDLKFKANAEFNILTNVSTDIEIQYPSDQKDKDIINEYTVVYQKEKE